MDSQLSIDRARCAGTGVCLSIAPGHLRLDGEGLATVIDATTLSAEQARAAAACCPTEAISVLRQPARDARFRIAEPIVTLGPAGTDADAEAGQHTDDVRLVDSFATAMSAALLDARVRALVAAGYLALDEQDRVTDSWVDQHFTHTGALEIQRCWESPTKPMCLATHRGIAPAAIATVATHPATRVFARDRAPAARLVTVTAKPLAALAAAGGEVDACIASVDVVARYPQLTVIEEFQPTMLWLLYAKTVTDE